MEEGSESAPRKAAAYHADGTDMLLLHEKILQTLPGGAIVYHPSGTCLFANRAAARISGIAGRDLRKEDFSACSSWREQVFLDSAGEALATGRTVRLETQITTTVEKLWLDCQFIPLPYRDSTFVLLTLENITPRVMLREQTLRHEATLAGINAIFMETMVGAGTGEVGCKCLTVLQMLTGSAFGLISLAKSGEIIDYLAVSEPAWHFEDQISQPAITMVRTMKYLEQENFLQAVAACGETVNAGESPAVSPVPGLSGFPPDLTSFVAYPFKRRGALSGVIFLADRKRGYSRYDMETVEAVAVAFTEALLRERFEEALRAEEEKALMYLDTARVMMVAINLDGTVTSINKKGCEILGKEKDEIEGRNWFDHFLPERDRCGAKTLFQNIVRGEETPVEYHESPVLDRNGQERTIAWHNSFLYDSSRSVTGLLRSGDDITGRLIMEEALKASEERFRILFDQAPDAIVVMSADTGRIVAFNESAHRNLGYTREELANLSLADIEAQQSAGDMKRYLNTILEKKGSHVFNTRHRTINGDIRDIRVTARCMTIGNRQVIQSIWTDLTEQCRMVTLLQESEKRFRNLISRMADGILVLDSANTILLSNQAAADLLGKSSNEMLRSRFEHQVSGDRAIEITLPSAGGPPRVVELLGAGTTWQGQKASILSLRDITELKHLQGKLQSIVKDLARSNKDLEQFAYVASHDLQEPLRKIMFFGDYIINRCADNLNEKGQDYLGRMVNAADRMSMLIASLLEFSRIATRDQNFEPVDLQQVAGQVLSDLQVRIDETGARIEVGELPEIEADRIQVSQLLQNLLQNALKFVRDDEAPLIQVDSCSKGDGMVEISVKDNGIGFDVKHRKQIFKPFKRLHYRGQYTGVGIGLAVCEKIAARHGGTITAASEPGRGSTFTVTLPVRHPQWVALSKK